MKKKIKGMSLIEIVVSIAVLMVISLILVIGCDSAVYNARVAKRVSDKCAAQAPIAATRNAAEADKTDITIHLTPDTGDLGAKGDINVSSYEVKNGENPALDKSGNYRYFVLK